mmetsp:Transcript_3257/g.3656  ORF Transcript_3257/g.3656 Transcript_3257/m.3656 type:complete len:106 (-) Transcript_3257:329-646(-)
MVGLFQGAAARSIKHFDLYSSLQLPATVAALQQSLDGAPYFAVKSTCHLLSNLQSSEKRLQTNESVQSSFALSSSKTSSKISSGNSSGETGWRNLHRSPYLHLPV